MPAYKAEVRVRLKKVILDPQGRVVKSGLHRMGYRGVRDVRVGKLIEVELDGDSPEQVAQRLDEMCRRLLANPVIEDYEFAVRE